VRVIFWAELFRPDIGGVEVLSLLLLQAMRAKGYEFRAVACHGAHKLPDVSEFEGVQVHRFRFHRPLLEKDLRQTMEIVKQVGQLKQSFRPDLIHIVTTQPSLLYHLQSEAAYRCPVLLTLCEPIDFSLTANSLLGRALASATWVNAVSEATLASALRLAPDISERSSVVHNGLPLPDLKPQSLPVKEPRLFCAGRLVKEKGFDLALRAFASVVARFPNARLTIAGDGPARLELEELARELRLNSAVDFLGWVEPERIPELMSQSTIVVMPSRWQEPFGLVSLQGSQMERPVVASRVGGLPEVVADGETGLLVENEDVNGLASAIIHLIENPRIAQQMGKAGRKRAQRLYSIEAHVAAYEKLYQQIAALPRVTAG
jgi:glycogen(starch) synthase